MFFDDETTEPADGGVADTTPPAGDTDEADGGGEGMDGTV